MDFKKVAGLILTGVALNLSMLADVNAAAAGVKCQVSTSRSKIFVSGGGLSGTVYARVTSGAAIKYSRNKAADANGAVGFGFDSNQANITVGATKIPATFIKGGKVNAQIRRTGTNALIGYVNATCLVTR